MANEISAQSIQISKNQGLTQALRAHVAKDAKVTAQQWDKTIDTLIKINEQRKASGSATIFTGGTDKSKAGYHTSFIVQPNQKIDFSKDEMAQLYSAMGLSIGAAKAAEETDKTEELKPVAEEKVAVEEKVNDEPQGVEEKAPMTKAEKKALKEKLKKEKAHDQAAIDTTVPRETDHRSKAQKKFTKANKTLITLAYNAQSPYIKEGTRVINGEEYTYKTAKFGNEAGNTKNVLKKAGASFNSLLYGGSRYVTAIYDKNGEMVAVEINSDKLRKNSAPDVKYTQNAAYADTKRKQAGYEVKITEGFDFDAIKAVTEKIFAKEAK